MPTVDESPCPSCGATGTLALDEVLSANPIGSFSLAGAQMKVTAKAKPRLTWSVCGLSLLGEYDTDGRHATFPEPGSAQHA